MKREWCVVVRPAAAASGDQRRRLKQLFERPGRQLERRQQGGDMLALVTERQGLERTESEVMRLLARKGLAGAVVVPLPIGQWKETLGRYIVVSPSKPQPAPVVPADQIDWLVSVRPTSAFDWRAVRAALAERGRTTIRETEQTIDVGARNEDDAHDLVAELSRVAAIGNADASRLDWYRRWRVRQQLLGNYAEMNDPTGPLL